jgi:hypothetical protein
LHELGDKTRDSVLDSVCGAILNQKIFSFSITEISQPLPECLDNRPRVFGAALPHRKSYSRDFPRLLRLGYGRNSKQYHYNKD